MPGEENRVKILAQASAFITGLSSLDRMKLDPDLRKDAVRDLATRYLKKGACDLFPGIDELIIGDVTVRTPQYDKNKIHHSHTLGQIKNWVEPQLG